MGITFRSGDYIRFVRCGGRTIKDGEAAAIWNRNGVHTQVVGPKRVWLWFSTIRFLSRYTAEANQYIFIRHSDGREEVVKGPVSMYRNPAWHDKMDVRSAHHLATQNDCLVVCAQNDTASTVAKPLTKGHLSTEEEGDTKGTNHFHIRIVVGPQVFFPQANEFNHEFSWSDLPENLETFRRGEIPSERRTQQILHLHKQRFWKCVVPLRTLDGVRLTATLSLTYSLVSVQKCLLMDDPMPTLVSSLLADAQAIGQSFSASSDKKDLVKKLEVASSFATLWEAAERHGFRFGDKIQVLGVDHTLEAQKKMDRAHIEASNVAAAVRQKKKERELRQLEFEEEEQRLEKAAELKTKKSRLDAETDEHNHTLQMAALERELSLQTKRLELEKLTSRQADESVLEFLEKLKNLGVDLSVFMNTVGGIEIAQQALKRSDTLQPLMARKDEQMASPAAKGN